MGRKKSCRPERDTRWFNNKLYKEVEVSKSIHKKARFQVKRGRALAHPWRPRLSGALHWVTIQCAICKQQTDQVQLRQWRGALVARAQYKDGEPYGDRHILTCQPRQGTWSVASTSHWCHLLVDIASVSQRFSPSERTQCSDLMLHFSY